MTSLVVDQISGHRTASQGHAVRMLQVFAVTLMVFPSDTVIKAIGAGGYVAALVAYLMFLAYIAVTLFGLHNPLDYRYPIRIALCVLWLVALASYSLMDRAMLSSVQQSSADRWLIQLAGVSGVILVAAEFPRSLDDIHRVLRALVWGGTFSSIVGLLQFLLALNITGYLGSLPGFSVNQAVGVIAIGSRSGLHRVAGTATDPIEFGVVAGMLLPLAVYLAIHDKERSNMSRYFPPICIAAAVPIAISRAAILAVALALGVLVISLRPPQRLTVIAAIPLALAAIYVASPRLIGTLEQYFLAGTSDSSIAHRVDNYPYAEHLVRQNLLFGQGGGTYVSVNYINLGLSHILDNQYLDTAIELGLVGLAVLIFYLLRPFSAALAARRCTDDPRLRDLCAALAGSALAALVCSATCDSFSFPTFVYVQALVAGLIGAVWLYVNSVSRAASDANLLFIRPETKATRIYNGKLSVRWRKLMDLLSIIQALWRHKLAVIPVIMLTILASFYVVKIKPAVYQASSSILLTNPPPAATQSQIAENPKLRKVNPYNTFANYGTLSVIAQAIIDAVTSSPIQSALVKSGVDRRYQLALSTTTDEPTAPPIIDITSFGATAQQAVRGANLLDDATKADLYQLQNSEGINSFYMVKAVDIVNPYQGQVSTSGKLRSLVAVLGVGVILLLAIISVTDALDKRRRRPTNDTNSRRRRTPFGDADPRTIDRETARLNYGSRTWHDPIA